MKIGIVTDSHGDVRRLAEALKIIRAHHVDAVVHCGDVGSGCVELLGQSARDVYLVAGNTDTDLESIAQQAAIAGVHFFTQVVIVHLEDGRQLATTHGHEPMVMGGLIGSQLFPYVLHGHTHKVRDERIGKTRVINSGALHRIHQPTAAVLDTTTDELLILPVGHSHKV